MNVKLFAISFVVFLFVTGGVSHGWPGAISASVQQRRSAATAEGARTPEEQSPEGYRYYVMGNRNSDINPERAAEQYKTALKKGYDTVELRLRLGRLLRLLKRPEEAFEHYRAATRIDAEDMRPHLSLAHALLDARRYEEALGEFEFVKKLSPEEYKLGMFSDDIGKSLDALERYEEALKEYEASLRCGCNGELKDDLVRRRIEEIKIIINLPK